MEQEFKTMENHVFRIYTEKRPEFDNEALGILHDIKAVLRIEGVDDLKLLHRYDIQGITEEMYDRSRFTVFAEPPLDFIFDEDHPALAESENTFIFGREYLPGQYDQRADSAAQAIQILTRGEKPAVRYAAVLVILGSITEADRSSIKKYVINPVDSRESSLEKPSTLLEKYDEPPDIPVLKGLPGMDNASLKELITELGLAMDINDLSFFQSYFRDHERRDPTLTELRIIDTYWSDHCRHTTFMTIIDGIDFKEGPYKKIMEQAYQSYLLTQRNNYGAAPGKSVCLMDLATIAMKEIKRKGLLPDLDESDEINACSIVVPVERNGLKEEWLVMFKNETHNHPTEIEPFGGAATCIGGAIRDPLSGRSYVYQAMRVTGSGDPRKSSKDTLPGKLPQRKICTEAAHGYSSYGNQIGLATGHVAEVYDEGYVAKRMEIGAVIGAAPRKAVRREVPVKGDVVILLGGKTGRDGCGGATGSSKIHTEESIAKAGAEVQKGNAPEERKIQRLFRNPEVALLVKRCNDFGAGGVSVAIGEIAPGLLINLDAVPKKYKGLDGTELAISESQERMAVVTGPLEAQSFIEAAGAENLEAVIVAEVTSDNRVRMTWRGKTIADIGREFLNSSGAERHTKVEVLSPDAGLSPFTNIGEEFSHGALGRAWTLGLTNLNSASEKGLVEMFDSSIGALTVNMPFGGGTGLAPSQSMCAKLPVQDFDTTAGTVMSWGFDPSISKWSPYHGGLYAVVDSVAKAAAAGADYSRIRLSLQEYFERLGNSPSKWGKPFASLLGAYSAQMELSIPAIGGKDSMSGSFNDLSVPPTLVSFAVAPVDVTKIITPEFKKAGSPVFYLPLRMDDAFIPDWPYFCKVCSTLYGLILDKKIISARSIGAYGICEAVSKMSFGNMIGLDIGSQLSRRALFGPGFGSFVIEASGDETGSALAKLDSILLGYTAADESIKIEGVSISLENLAAEWLNVLNDVYPFRTKKTKVHIGPWFYDKIRILKSPEKRVKPSVLIPVFPGTNCEYDSARAFEKAGAEPDIFIFRNRTKNDIEESISGLVSKIGKSQIIMIPGGFSAGDEPEGSGKFIAAVFRNGFVSEAVMELLKKRGGLILGVCNGFQALIKLGLVPYGEIRDLGESSPTLTYNSIGRHMSSMIRTMVVSKLSPWFYNSSLGDVHTLPVSHGEGRFAASAEVIEELKRNGQIATQYVDENGSASMDMPYNPNGSSFAVEGITSPDGRILGKMAHSERTGPYTSVNIPGNKFQPIFEAGVSYFK